MKTKIIISIGIFLLTSILWAELSSQRFLKVGLSSMKPFFENDQWYVSEIGYHYHPRTEDFTPGLYFCFEQYITSQISIELGVLAAFPPATLGVLDQYSSSGREYLETEKYMFTALTVSPQIQLYISKKMQFYGGPILGAAISNEKEITPTFGESIKWTQHGELIYGGKIGMEVGTNNKNISILSEIFVLSVSANLKSVETNKTLNKFIGPVGIVIGINYKLNKE